MSLNLLELPVEVLEEIISYCVGSLLILTETNSNFKDIIENSSRLMKHIQITVRYPYRENMALEIFEAFFNSTRKYQKAKFVLNDHHNPKIFLKCLFVRFGNSLRNVDFYFEQFDRDSLVEVLEHCEYLENVETFNLIINEVKNGDLETLRYESSCMFNKLRELELFIFGCPAALEVFENCKNIKILSFDMGDYGMDYEKLYSILVNCREALQSLKFHFNELDDTDETINNALAEVFPSLKNCNLNLKSFKIDLKRKLWNENVTKLVKFIKTQKNLKKLTFENEVNGFFLNSAKDLLLNLNVEELELFIYKRGSDLCQPWQLPDSLEILRVQSTSKHLCLVSIICHSPSQQLVELSLTKIDMNNDGLATITNNYPNLTSLKLIKCRNYSSDDIYLILKHLKKLKQLNFKFPEGSILNNDLFTKNEDLQLPHIQEVCFDFNNALKNYQVKRLMHSISQTSVFTIHDYCNKDILDNITRELVNLKELTFKKNKHFNMNLRRIKHNVNSFNKNPHLFKVCGKNIGCWLELPTLKKSNCNCSLK